MKKMLLFIIVAFLLFEVKSKKEQLLLEEKIKEFQEEIEESGLIVVDKNEVSLVFDYDYLEGVASEMFSEYEIVRESDISFVLRVKEKEERFYLKRGDRYEDNH